MTKVLAFLLTSAQIVIVEPPPRPWAPPSGVSEFTQQRVGRWRVSTWTANDSRVVRLQRRRSGFTLIYERSYEYGQLSDSAEVVVANCAHGDPVMDGPQEPHVGAVRSALLSHLAWCEVPASRAARMLQGLEDALPLVLARSRAAAAAAATGAR